MGESVSFVVRTPADWQRAVEAVKRAHANPERPFEVIVRRYSERRTDAQNRTLWKWHGEVAAQLSAQTTKRWSIDEVHQWIFTAGFCPVVEAQTPDGVTRVIPRRSSMLTVGELHKAMNDYREWAHACALELTDPEAAQ